MYNRQWKARAIRYAGKIVNMCVAKDLWHGSAYGPHHHEMSVLDLQRQSFLQRLLAM